MDNLSVVSSSWELASHGGFTGPKPINYIRTSDMCTLGALCYNYYSKSYMYIVTDLHVWQSNIIQLCCYIRSAESQNFW